MRPAALLNPITLLLFLVLSRPALAQQDQTLRNSHQLIVVTTPGWSSVTGRLQRYERKKPGHRWKRIGDPLAIVVGKNGTGWGRGLIPPPGPISLQDPVKKEGDGKSPAGVFRLTALFGYAPQPLPGWKMSYIPLTPSVECVDDPASLSYNRIVDRSTIPNPDWHSSEKMANAGTAYVWGAVIDQNPSPPTAFGGSCVFLHIWAGPAQGTAGCTAMPQDQLEPILAWLDPARSPLFVQLPIDDYKKLRRPWHLPKPPKS